MELPKVMSGVYLTRHGDFDALEFRSDIPLPKIGPSDCLVKVLATSVNNTDINTRIGWYASDVLGDTEQVANKPKDTFSGKAAWSGQALAFPLIQGIDLAGEVVAVGAGVDDELIGERVLGEAMHTEGNWGTDFKMTTFGSELDGAFAQFARVPVNRLHVVDTNLTDTELGVLPCAYSTAESMQYRAGLTESETVLITGASGGVGHAAVILAKLRGAKVIAQASSSKHDALIDLGADQVIGRDGLQTLGENAVDVVLDVVAGEQVQNLLKVMKPFGRYAVSGAISGPIVNVDFRDLYLKDISMIGSTVQHPKVFKNLVAYINSGVLQPVVAAEFPLSQIVDAQKKFLAKDFVGKVALNPWESAV